MLSEKDMIMNWDKFIGFINTYITGERKQAMLTFYNQYKERLIVMPAATLVGTHSWFEGGYIHHVNNVVECSLKIEKVWREMGVMADRYTIEELVFSAINHDLGKMGDKDYACYIPNPSEWHRVNQGLMYTFDPRVQYMTVPDRSLFLLQQHGIQYNQNEFIAIKNHDGLYEKGNEQYLMPRSMSQKLYSSLTYILHQGDLMAARIEFEQQYTFEIDKKYEARIESSIPGNIKVPRKSSKDKAIEGLTKDSKHSGQMMDVLKNFNV